jgi:DUF971 family protein
VSVAIKAWRSVGIAAAISCLAVALALSGGYVAGGDAADDSTAALQARLDQLQPGETLILEDRTYLHSGVIQIRVPGVRIDGNGATLQATNDETSSVQILAHGVSLTNMSLSAAPAGQRWTGLDQHKLVVGANDVTVSDVTITGSAAAGVFIDGAHNFQISGVHVQDTRADGIHMTGASSHGRISHPIVGRTGDDGVAVVSYSDDPGPCRDIVVDSPVINGTRWGRGVSVVGGENVSIRNVNVVRTNGAGVYIATEGGPQFYTRSVTGVDVNGGVVAGANVNPDVVQGAVLVYAGHTGERVENVTVSNLAISTTAVSAQRNVGVVVERGGAGNIAFRDINLERTDLPAVDGDMPRGDYTASGFTLDGSPIEVP